MSSTSDREWPEGAIPAEWIDSLWQRMLAYYGARFADMWRDTDTESIKRLWAKQLGKLTREQLCRGVAALEHAKWPPTLPEFVAMCSPAPNSVEAYYEAIAGLQERSKGDLGTWSHPAVFWAAAGMAHDLRSMSFSQVRERWEAALRAEWAKGQWEPIPTPDKMLPPPPKSATPKHKVNLRAVFKPTDPDAFDHQRWARRILERAKQPNHGLSEIQIEMAQNALKTAQKSP